MSDEQRLLERFEREVARIPLPPRERWSPATRALRRPPVPLALAAGALSLLIALGVGAALRAARESAESPAAAPGRSAQPSPVPTVAEAPRFFGAAIPRGWEVVVSQHLLLTVPQEWGGPQPAQVRPDPPILAYVLFPRGELNVSLWSSTDVERLVEERFVRGNLQPITRRSVTAPRPAIELLVDGIRWSDPTRNESGSYQARHLLVQIAPGVVADFVITARPLVANQQVKVSAEQTQMQDAVVRDAAYLGDTERTLDRDRVERVLRMFAPTLERKARGPGPGISRGDEMLLEMDSPHSFVYVITYQDRAARLRDDPNEGGSVGATVEWVAPVTYRGIGNILVVVGSDDPGRRYMLIRALDLLLE